MLNYSSVLIFWHAPPNEHQNGIIREYRVELSNNNTTVSYTTEGPFLLVGNLKPNINYSCSIAAYTIMRGPFSETVTILVRQENYISNRDMGGLNTFTCKWPCLLYDTLYVHARCMVNSMPLSKWLIK